MQEEENEVWASDKLNEEPNRQRSIEDNKDDRCCGRVDTKKLRIVGTTLSGHLVATGKGGMLGNNLHEIFKVK